MDAESQERCLQVGGVVGAARQEVGVVVGVALQEAVGVVVVGVAHQAKKEVEV